ncbi:hypothetical protein [Kineococcus sp. SYSU DK003]|uniref:hypothetical protein n=1 Tax=Kineococcus sp. SYSU DK003 TaxID=3383124 RepID=UPI003D7CA591
MSPRGSEDEEDVPPEPPESRESLQDERSADDRDEGWGERSGSGFDDEWYLSQRPPHWD